MSRSTVLLLVLLTVISMVRVKPRAQAAVDSSAAASAQEETRITRLAPERECDVWTDNNPSVSADEGLQAQSTMGGMGKQ